MEHQPNLVMAVCLTFDCALFILLRLNYRFRWYGSLGVGLASLAAIVAMIPFNNGTFWHMILMLLPGFAGALVLSGDKPLTTVYVFFDRANWGFATSTIRALLLRPAHFQSIWRLALSYVPVLLLVAWELHRRGTTRRVLAWMNRMRGPLFVLPLSITVLTRVVLHFTSQSHNWTPYVSLATVVVIFITSYFVEYTVTQAEKAANAEVMAAEVQMMDNLAQMQRQQIERYEENRASIERFRHDARHHIRLLAGLLQQGRVDEALDYLRAERPNLAADPMPRYCKHPAVNVVLSIYIGRATAQGIRVQYHTQVPRTLPFEDTDLAALFANIIENAIEACDRLPAGQESAIRIYAECGEDSLSLQVENTCLPQLCFTGEQLPASQKPGGGVGTRSIRHIAEKYDGMLEFSARDGQCRVRVLLCAPGAGPG